MVRSLIFEQKPRQLFEPYILNGGLSREEIEKVFTQVEQVPLINATTEGNDSLRESKVKWLPQNPEWDWLYDKILRIAAKANEAYWGFDLTTAQEGIQYTEYHGEEEGRYDWHADTGAGVVTSTRKVSVTVQLSGPEEYDGGNLELFRGGHGIENSIIAERRAGTVVVFPSYMMHRVSPVTRGVRKSLVLWVGGAPFK